MPKFVWTLLFQVLNFFVLLFVLYKLLYKPVRNAMKTREAQIKQRYDEAEGKIKDAERARAESEAKQHELDAQRAGLLDEAKAAAAARSEALLDEARQQADQLIERARDAIGREWRQAADGLGDTLGRTVIALCAKVLETSGGSLTDHAAAEAVEAIGSLEGDDLDEARRAVEHGPVTVLAASALSGEAQRKIATALGAKAGRSEAVLHVEQDESLVAGIELKLGALRIRAHWRERLEEALAAAQKEVLTSAPHSESGEEDSE